MTDRERAVCSRISTIREQIKWSQTDFAKELEITRAKLVSIELGHTPLRYDLAVKISRIFEIQPKWLATGTGQMRPHNPLLWTMEQRQKFKENDLLTKVYDIAPGVFLPSRNIKIRKSLVQPDFDFRRSIDSAVKYYAYSIKFHDVIASAEFASKIADFLSKVSDQYIARGKATKVTRDSKWAAAIVSQISELTNVYDSVNNTGVTPKLPNLLNRLKKASEQRGKKSALAKFLGVSLVQVSQWLMGDREPGGETTLRLLHWVEQQERQK